MPSSDQEELEEERETEHPLERGACDPDAPCDACARAYWLPEGRLFRGLNEGTSPTKRDSKKAG